MVLRNAEEKNEITDLSLATRHRDIHKPSCICDSLLCAALGRLLLFLRFDLISPSKVSEGALLRDIQ